MKNCFYRYFLILLVLASCGSDDARLPLYADEDNSLGLFFSEYVEGTSFNKALEIVNLTGSSINLASQGYSIKKQSNGEGNWVGELLLTGSIANNAVYVIANENTTHPDILNNASLLKAGSPMDFNGNDAIGLFKEGILIDIIGHFDDPEEFGKDVTMRRRSEVTEPSTTYDPNEWDLYETDNVGGLGSY